MKLSNLEEINKVKNILPGMHFYPKNEKVYLFFPIDLKNSVTETNEYGITTTQYKNETHYGSTLVSGICGCYQLGRVGKVIDYSALAYVSSVDLFSFNLSEYFLINNTNLTEEDKKYLCKFEVALAIADKTYVLE